MDASKHSIGTRSASSSAERKEPIDVKLPAGVSSDEFCRICLLKAPNLKPLLERVDGVMIPEMLYKLCGRQIEVQEGYPRSICQRCFCQLDCAFRFLNEFQRQDERLRSFYWSGTVAQKLQEYQSEGSETVDKRLEELIGRHGKLFDRQEQEPAKEMCNKQTNTSIVQPTMIDASTATDKEKFNLQLVKTEEDPDDDALLEHYVMEEENDDSYLDYNIDSMDSTMKEKRQQVVEMKIDVLQSVEETDSYIEVKSRKRKVSQQSRYLSECRREARVKQASPETAVEESIPTDTDNDPGQEEQIVYEETDPEDGSTEETNDDTFDKLRCYICDTTESTEELLEQHLDMHSTMLPYECTVCLVDGATPRPIKTVSSLHNHFRSHCFPYWCDICSKRFLRKMQLDRHKHSHSNNLFVCDECGRGFTHKKSWQNHMKRHTALRAEVYKCSTCGKAFGNKARLERHMRLHTGDKPHGCKYCEKRFYDRHQLQRHTEKHFRDMECRCEYCGETFQGSRKLDAHKKEKHLTGKELEEFLSKEATRTSKRQANLKDSLCPYPNCNYVAKTYGAMYVHKRSKHLTGHQCEICDKSFAFLNQYQVHMKLHTGEKPFQCELCGRSFRRGFSYREHMEMHTSETNYNCPTCNKSFKRPRYLQAHMLTHTSVRKFSCEICGNAYKTNGELKKHNKNKHGLDILEQDVVIETEGQSFIVEYV
ncbi:zinc finger protein 431-like [Anopheles maculipalpis]|uniref:zinc finger protein 431-like n=1 Tax=Anopheles maculipalpis TaxID=1496333 RepID=UPI0021591330|nr:zinc finger protein 431-like [Anopheles maculipalpis]